MKTNKLIMMFGLATCVAISTTSCKDSFLDTDNPTGETVETYYTTGAHINEALNAAYAVLHWENMGINGGPGSSYSPLDVCSEIMSDNTWTGGATSADMLNWQMISNYSGDSNNTLSNLWNVLYTGVKRCNDVIAYLDLATDMTDADKASCSAQARLLRVFYYNFLWHFFGNIPFYLENLNMPYQADQLQADDVYTQLIAELEDVLNSNVLPMEWADNSATDKNIGRVSQAMGYMLYAEMVMYQKDTARYPQALTYMKNIIADSHYGLLPNYADIWLESGEWSSESIFEINYNDDGTQHGYSGYDNAGGTILPTLISPNSWPGGQGMNKGQDGWGFMPLRTSLLDLFDDADTRKEATIFDGRGVAYTPRYCDTGLWLKKYIAQADNNKDAGFDQVTNYNNNLRIYRFAETLLNAAELSLDAGDAGSALTYLNQVHVRAGLPPLGSATLDNIIDERRLEFVGEGKRYWDLIRTDKAATTLVPAGDAAVATPTLIRTKAWDAHNKYLPIYQGDLDTSPNLVQNPGY